MPLLQAVSSHAFEATDEISASLLKQDQCVIVQAAGSILIWLGSLMPTALRPKALDLVDELVAKEGLDASARVEVVKQGLEGPEFTSLFSDWQSASADADGKPLSAGERPNCQDERCSSLRHEFVVLQCCSVFRMPFIQITVHLVVSIEHCQQSSWRTQSVLQQ